MDRYSATVEVSPSVLKLTIEKPPAMIYLLLGIPFVTISGCGLVAFGGIGLMIAIVLAKSGRWRQIVVLSQATIMPLLLIFLFLGCGLWFLWLGIKQVVEEAEIWTFDKAQYQLTLAKRYRDRRLAQHWEQTVQTYGLPEAGAVTHYSGYDEPDRIIVRIGVQTVRIVSAQSLRNATRQIKEFLAQP